MEDWLGTFLDLQKMILRVKLELSYIWFHNANLEDFIAECEQFQMDLLRPWDRTD